MGWKLRTTSVVLLVVLSALPSTGTLCAMACDDQAAPADTPGHHHAAAPEANPPAPSDAPVIGGPSLHACDHAAAIQQAATAPERTQMAASTPAAIVTLEPLAAPIAESVRAPHGAPPGSAPPTSTPRVLRV